MLGVELIPVVQRCGDVMYVEFLTDGQGSLDSRCIPVLSFGYTVW
jgi:hypothetical protein